MSRYNRRNVVSKTFKDYLVPFIGFLLIFILIISFLGGNKDATSTNNNSENKIGLNISLDGENSEAYIEYIGGDKKDINSSETKLFKGEKIVVKKGDIDLSLEGIGKMKLNNRGELKYNEDGSFSLFSSDLWVNTDSPLKLNFRYGSIDLRKETVASITQNEAASTVYILDGLSEVENTANMSTMLGKGQKIIISNKDSSDDSLDLSLLKEEIDDHFKTIDWFIKNNGDFYLTKNNSGTGTVDEGEKKSENTGYITLEGLNDEDQVSTSTINLKGKLNNDDIASIYVNGKEAKLDLESKTFEIKGFNLEKQTNDLVFKLYNSSKEILSKKVYTIYYSQGKEKETTGIFKVENFSLDATKFQFIFPKVNPYTTFADLVSIEGKVPPGIVESIGVNGYKLQKFPRNGSYWKYHANKDFGNLKEGLNIYKVIYYGVGGKVLHSNAFTIIKKERVTAPKKKIISDETST